MTYDTIRHDAREQLDAEYESSTQGADSWRDRVAQRHRFGRALDEPPASPPDDDGALTVWLYFAVVVVALVVIWLVAA